MPIHICNRPFGTKILTSSADSRKTWWSTASARAGRLQIDNRQADWMDRQTMGAAKKLNYKKVLRDLVPINALSEVHIAEVTKKAAIEDVAARSSAVKTAAIPAG